MHEMNSDIDPGNIKTLNMDDTYLLRHCFNHGYIHVGVKCTVFNCRRKGGFKYNEIYG